MLSYTITGGMYSDAYTTFIQMIITVTSGLVLLQIIADAAPPAGIEVVECSPPYENAEITALISTRVICDTLGCLVRSGHLPTRPRT